jgi:chlorite dismutase
MRVSFIAGTDGAWKIDVVQAVRGASLRAAPRIARIEGDTFTLPDEHAAWALDGVRSNERYTTASEKRKLAAAQPPLDRVTAVQGALIPIKKAAAWWALAQDERRALFEDRSRHIAIGLEYSPAIARRLYHCRDIGGEFDFLTWFEYAPSDGEAFCDMVARLRATPEWEYVEREVEIFVHRA